MPFGKNRRAMRLFYDGRLTSNAVSSFCGRELSYRWPRLGRNPSETRTIFIRSLAEVLTPEIRCRVTAKVGGGKLILDKARPTP